jgi:hypothetical protein
MQPTQQGADSRQQKAPTCYLADGAAQTNKLLQPTHVLPSRRGPLPAWLSPRSPPRACAEERTELCLVHHAKASRASRQGITCIPCPLRITPFVHHASHGCLHQLCTCPLGNVPGPRAAGMSPRAAGFCPTPDRPRPETLPPYPQWIPMVHLLKSFSSHVATRDAHCHSDCPIAKTQPSEERTRGICIFCSSLLLYLVKAELSYYERRGQTS